MYKSLHSHVHNSLPSLSNPKRLTPPPPPLPPPPAAALLPPAIPPNPEQVRHDCHHDNPTAATTIPDSSMFSSARRIMLAFGFTRRSRCCLLILCSPILVPLLCVTFPILCAVELCMRFCRRSRRKKDALLGDDDRLRRCEEGFCDCDRVPAEEEKEVGLLQRYLEDQLRLVGSVYDCGDEIDNDDEDEGDEEEEEEEDCRNLDFRSPLLG